LSNNPKVLEAYLGEWFCFSKQNNAPYLFFLDNTP
jgi:hypothetical protein